jgi:23S rRNA (adenine2503-C2)-methyltransferase
LAETLPLHALTPALLEPVLAELGVPAYRARQVLAWVYGRGATDPAAMSDLPRALRERLAERLSGPALDTSRLSRSADGTVKMLLALGDAEVVEGVLIPDDDRLTLCVSSQVGCGMGCGFCATARLGLRRNLRVEEIVGQVVRAREVLERERVGPGHLTNLVFMGMGEPLHNLDRLLAALEILTAPWGLGISPRRITVSTVGLLPQMRRLLAATKVHLAVSLSATTEEKRRELMPVTRRYGLAELMETCRALPLPRRKRITFEYVMLAGENDSDADARRLVGLLHGIRAKVNLIIFNPFPDAGFTPSPRAQVERFQAALLDRGVHATIRESRGPDIAAACGQLAAQHATAQ